MYIFFTMVWLVRWRSSNTYPPHRSQQALQYWQNPGMVATLRRLYHHYSWKSCSHKYMSINTAITVRTYSPLIFSVYVLLFSNLFIRKPGFHTSATRVHFNACETEIFEFFTHERPIRIHKPRIFSNVSLTDNQNLLTLLYYSPDHHTGDMSIAAKK